MSKNADLAVLVGANTDPLAADLRAAVKQFQEFQKSIQRKNVDIGVAKQAAKEAAGIKQSAKEVSDAQKRAAKESADVWRNAQSAAAGLRGGLGGVAGALAGTANAAAQAREAYKTAGGAGIATFAKATGVLLAAGLALDGIKMAGEGVAWTFGQIKDSIWKAADMESLTLTFDVMLGGAKQAQEMVAGLRQFAATTPFNSREVAGAGKQLLAYGIAADQIIPTLRMLGDVSAGFGQDLPLKELTTKYGQMFSQQKIDLVDIKELAGRGIPIYDELAKVIGTSVAEVKELVSQDRIGRDQITQSFINMTSAGGKFFNMTRRQADTFAGTWEQMTDAFDLAKAAFGRVLIRDLGLKEAVKNAEAFGQRIERNAESMAPYVRMVGNLGHAVGQVAFQFSKAAFEGANFAEILIDSAFPEIREAAKQLSAEIDAFLKDGKDFKIKPSIVSQMVFETADKLATVFIDTLSGIKAIGEGLRNDFVKPIQEGMQGMLRMWLQAKDLVGQATPAEKFRPPAAFEQDEQIVKRFRALFQEQVATALELQAIGGPIGDKKQLTKDEADRYRLLLDRQKELEALRKSFLGEITTPEHFVSAQHRLVRDGVVPPMKSRGDVALGDTGFLSRAIKNIEERQGVMREKNAAVLAKLIAEEVGQAVADALKSQQQVKDIRDNVTGPAGVAAALGPYGALMIPPPSAVAKPKSDVRLQGDLPAGALELKKQLREKYEPLHPSGELMRIKGDLDALLKRGEITQGVHNLGWRDAVGGVAERRGIGGPTHLPEAYERGSVESVRAINQANAGNPQATVEDLLRQLLVSSRMIEKKTAEVNIVNIPQ